MIVHVVVPNEPDEDPVAFFRKADAEAYARAIPFSQPEVFELEVANSDDAAELLAGLNTVRLPPDVGLWVRFDQSRDDVPPGSVGVVVQAFRDGAGDDAPTVWDVYVPAVQPNPRLSTNTGGGKHVFVPAGSLDVVEVAPWGD